MCAVSAQLNWVGNGGEYLDGRGGFDRAPVRSLLDAISDSAPEGTSLSALSSNLDSIEHELVPASVEASAPLTLRRNFRWVFVGNVVYAGSQWGMLTVLAKLGSPEMVGKYALGLAVTAPVIVFSNLQLRGIQATDARRDYSFSDYVSLRIYATLLAFAVIAALASLGSYSLDTRAVIVLVGLSKAFESISDVFYGLLQQHERMDRIAISMMIKGPLSLAVLAGVVYSTRSLVAGAAALAAVWLCLMLTYDLRSCHVLHRGRIIIHANMAVLVKLALLALPLGIVMLLISLNTNIPRYLIEHYLGERDLGFFAAIAYIMVSGGTVVSALGQSAVPRLAKYYAAGDREAFVRLLCRLLLTGLLIGATGFAVVLVAGRSVLSALYTPDYARHATVFTMVAIASCVIYIASFLGYGMTAARYFKLQVPLMAMVAVSTATSGYLLIPRYGLMGAAMSLLAAAIVQAAGSALINVKAIVDLKKVA